MIKVSEGDCSKHSIVCSICEAACTRIFVITYDERLYGKITKKESWVCHHCMKELIDGVNALVYGG